jgi:hypothetical protein
VKDKFLPRKTNLILLMRRPGLLMRAYRFPMLFLAIGALADVITTYNNLALYGTEVEVHLPQRIISEIFGMKAGVPLAKIIQLAFVILVACWWRPWCGFILCACGLLYTFAALSNHFLWL